MHIEELGRGNEGHLELYLSAFYGVGENYDDILLYRFSYIPCGKSDGGAKERSVRQQTFRKGNGAMGVYRIHRLKRLFVALSLTSRYRKLCLKA